MSAYSIYLRHDAVRKNTAVPVYLRAIVERKKKDYSLGVAVIDPEKFWDDTTKRMKRCSWQDYERVNRIITDADARADKIMFHYKHGPGEGLPFTINDFSREFKKNPAVRADFYQYAEAERLKLSKTGASAETLRSYASYISKMKKYRPTLLFSDISKDFVNDYHAHMVSIENQPNTVHKALSWMRTILKRARVDGYINHDPFEGKKLVKKAGKRDFLTGDELAAVEKLYQADNTKRYLHNTLRCFLFSCYTGLRYTDVKNIRYRDITDRIINKTAWKVIDIKMHKTKDPVSIPLIDKAAALVGEGLPPQRIFHTPSNQVINRFLKEVAAELNFNKTLTFHVARHTFATRAISEGFPIEVVSKLLGHTTIGVTAIYAKILDEVKVEHLQKFNHKPRKTINHENKGRR